MVLVRNRPDRGHLQCQNTSINPAPADCQWTPFWGIQANASGPFKDTVRGVGCGRWEWWSAGLQYLLRTALSSLLTLPVILSDPWALRRTKTETVISLQSTFECENI